MGRADTERLERAARSQSLFRKVNERVEVVNQAFNPLLEQGEWVCECADLGCVEQIEMSLAEYQELRADGNAFAVRPGHEVLEVETVLAANERYVVVAKLGAGGELAREIDPRADADEAAPTV
jgi:hypothetical protein